jgi:hypothetical protein
MLWKREKLADQMSGGGMYTEKPVTLGLDHPDTMQRKDLN